MVFAPASPPFDPSQSAVRAAYLADEGECVKALLDEAALDSNAAVRGRARDLVRKVRATPALNGLDAFLSEYDLGTREGIVLMCLAEGLLRIPDSATQDRLIHGLVLQGEWGKHLGKSQSLLVNASTWGLMLTGKIVRALSSEEAETLIRKLTSRLGDAALRSAMRAAMGILAGEFVIGQTIEEACSRTDNDYRYSFDMLGEAAITARDAERYFDSYLTAIRTVGGSGNEDIFSAPGVSIKLSALHPRYEFTQRERVLNELVARLFALVEEAKKTNVLVTLDAEEADRLEISLDVFKTTYRGLRGYEGFGLAVQAYQKRAPRVIDWLAALAKEHRRKIPLRLVKGAYWDTEIKRAQVQGLSGYPVFTRKVHTDTSYLACGRRMLNHRDAFYPQFATHNAHTIAYFIEAGGNTPFEFQRLYGMGEALYAQIVKEKACRIYAPVGSFDTLLPYLVRRLLENGANTSFVNRIADTKLPIEKVIADPVEALRGREPSSHPAIPLPRTLYGADRRNSHGLNLANPDTLAALAKAMEQRTEWQATSLVEGKAWQGEERELFDPADRTRRIGSVIEASEEALETALAVSHAAFEEWDATPARERARVFEHGAELFEQHRAELAALIVREGGRTVPDALAEIREAADYCRYYAAEARRWFSAPNSLPGPSGEDNTLALHGRGVFAALSPWNFPLAIFTGQITAALAAGNSVIAKPAEQTPLIAMRAIELLHEAGIPGEVLNFVPGAGESIGAKLVADSRIAGVVFTGSTETALAINRVLAAKEGPIVPLIAETGGMNAIIADSSALAEQLVADVIQSAYNSAGQRCSAARLLFVQEDIAEQVIALLKGAMAELEVGDPSLLSTDVGPLIDEEAKSALETYCTKLSLPLDGGNRRRPRESEGMERGWAKLLATAPLAKELERGCFFAPRLYEISIEQIPKREVFGPILHVIRWKANELDSVIAAINNTGYGLTLGIHSRIEETIEEIRSQVRVGNVYVNRNIIGAVVGVQPFGGEGLSGTGPKAGGPNYLARFALEKIVSVNTAAIGGNASLLALDDGQD